MFIAVAAAALPLLVIGADDERLQNRRTFVSEEARTELAKVDGERVLCIDRNRRRETYRSICLTEAQWRKAMALAQAKPKARLDFRNDIPIYFVDTGGVAQGGSLASAYP